jgi:endonuclease/exonuclease/phosphatase family metal-dependent hydrolase
MSFNLRYGTADTGSERSWESRLPRVRAVLDEHHPDILGTQETLAFQRSALSEGLPGHEVVAAGRDDGAGCGEMAAIFYDARRFTCLESGHFWLSETPEEPGSIGWDAELPRIVTWARLQQRGASPLLVVDTHFDHAGFVARRESARLVRSSIPVLAAGAPSVLLGDFNAPIPSEVHRLLAGSEAGPWVDVFDAVGTEPGGTFHDFTGHAGDSSAYRLDWILVSPEIRVRAAFLDRALRDGDHPSDHFPVLADIELPPPEA